MKRAALAVIHKMTGREVHTVAGIPADQLAREKVRLEQSIDRTQYLIRRKEK